MHRKDEEEIEKGRYMPDRLEDNFSNHEKSILVDIGSGLQTKNGRIAETRQGSSAKTVGEDSRHRISFLSVPGLVAAKTCMLDDLRYVGLSAASRRIAHSSPPPLRRTSCSTDRC